MKESVDKVYENDGNQDVLKLITSTGCTILDVGCGSGTLAKILSEMGHTVDGITISPEEYYSADIKCRKVYLYNLELGLPPELTQINYDYVICSHVLEHIVYPEKLLSGIYDIVKPGGYLIVALPNIMHYKSRLQLAAGKFEYKDAGIWDNTHVKWYTFETAKKMLLSHNFTIELATVTGELPFNSIFSKILPGSLRKSLFNFLIKVSKGFFGYQLLFKVKKNIFNH